MVTLGVVFAKSMHLDGSIELLFISIKVFFLFFFSWKLADSSLICLFYSDFQKSVVEEQNRRRKCGKPCKELQLQLEVGITFRISEMPTRKVGLSSEQIGECEQRFDNDVFHPTVRHFVPSMCPLPKDD